MDLIKKKTHPHLHFQCAEKKRIPQDTLNARSNNQEKTHSFPFSHPRLTEAAVFKRHFLSFTKLFGISELIWCNVLFSLSLRLLVLLFICS